MSCNGCRVLRKGCGENCVLKSCLEGIQSPVAQGHATLFLSKFFGRSDLLSLISAVPPGHQRTSLFQSLLYEAAGRTLNPVNGAMGLLSTGNWHLCEAAVQTVLDGGSPEPLDDENLIPKFDESSNTFQANGAWGRMLISNDDENFPSIPVYDDVAELGVTCRHGDGEEPKLLDLFR
uniref:LOB domain-containing protein 38-like n=1 Tax=Erigeron canadensis TaxID=72917 RepID=UPI001CB9C9E4|nr:LOB domain-containing protein 38-like [Erigeron canadensis]